MSTAATTAIRRLASIAGEQHVVSEPSQLAAYAVDGVLPAAAVRPGTADEVAAVVRLAAAEKLALIPMAGRTKLGIGLPPSRYDLAVDLTRLDRMVAYDPGDLTLSVEAAMGIHRLLDALAEKKQSLPMLVPFLERATVGGILASNSTSPLRQFYGTPRDFLLGLEFVTGDGARAKSGGRVVKNVAGYDLHKLMIGSLGTLGIITAANFRTFPVPREVVSLIAGFSHAAGALHLRRAIAQSPLQPLVFEILSPHAASLLLSGMDFHRPGLWVATIAAGGNESVVERHRRDIRELADRAGATAFHEILGDTPEKQALWSGVREFPSSALKAAPAAAVLKLSVLPSEFPALLDRAQTISDEARIPAAIVVRAVGTIGVALLSAQGDPGSVGLLGLACTRLCGAAVQAGGTASIEWCPAEVKRSVKLWWPERADADLMRRVKQVFDPHGVLAPGRFVGGL